MTMVVGSIYVKKLEITKNDLGKIELVFRRKSRCGEYTIILNNNLLKNNLLDNLILLIKECRTWPEREGFYMMVALDRTEGKNEIVAVSKLNSHYWFDLKSGNVMDFSDLKNKLGVTEVLGDHLL